MSTHPFYLARQPILDRDQQVQAYELLFRTSETNSATIDDDGQATATVLANAFGELSLSDVVGPYKAYINVPADFLMQDSLEFLPGPKVVLELPADALPDADLIARCRALKAKGFTLAAGNVASLDPARLPLLQEVDILKVDHQLLNNQELFVLFCHLKPLGRELLAEKIEDMEQLEHCQDLGFTLFQGYYFARPTLIAGKKLERSSLALVKLIGLLMEDAETSVLETTFKQEPGLTLNLLRLVNSVASGLAVRVGSVRHAITLMGRQKLLRWLQLLLYCQNGSPDAPPSPLLLTAATRGRLLELIQLRLTPRHRDAADRAFMTGILSLLPAALGVPMDELLVPLPLAAEVRQALLEGKGELGRLLGLAEEMERSVARDGHGGSAEPEALAQLAGLPLQALNACLAEALGWANSLAQEVAA